MLVALDIAPAGTGVAWGGPASGSPRCALWELPQGEHNYDRALKALRGSVMALIKFEKAEILALEAVLNLTDRFHSAWTNFLLTSLSAVAREAVSSYGCKIVPVRCQKWRSEFIGTGNLSGEESKRLAMKRCRELGWPYLDHNTAEACGVWYHGMAHNYRHWRPARAA